MDKNLFLLCKETLLLLLLSISCFNISCQETNDKKKESSIKTQSIDSTLLLETDDEMSFLFMGDFMQHSPQIKAAKDALEDLGLMNMLHAWSVGAAINMLTPSAAYMPAVRAMEHPSFYATPGDGAVEKLINYINNTNGLFYLFTITIGTLISIVFIIIFMSGLYKMVRLAWVENRNREILFLSLFIIIYFLTITGPIIGVKYRLPVEPIMTLFFAYAVSNLLRNKIHRKSGS